MTITRIFPMKSSLLFLICSLLIFKAISQQKPGNYIVHKADTRGQTDIGWLKSSHTFSFSDYYDPERMNFGVLRVLNDDSVDGGHGFPMHSHKNMEIISIPLDGIIEHKDNTGSQGIIKAGDIQIMSAGKGITHSEYNHSKSDKLKFLQIWVLPDKADILPRYAQKNSGLTTQQPNSFKKLLAPNDTSVLFINQNAVFTMGKFEKGKKGEYLVAFKGNGVYAFIIEGKAIVNGIGINRRDGIGLWNTDKVSLEASEDLQILLMDIPMYD